MSVDEIKRQKCLTRFLFGIYLLFLVWIILFKMEIHPYRIQNMCYRCVNFIPLRGTAVRGGHFDYMELGMNVLIFVPYGIYLGMLKEKWPFGGKVFLIMLSSIFLEVCQYIFALGASDITDVIGNTLGGIVGLGFYSFVFGVFRHGVLKVFNWLAGIGTLFVMALSIFMILANR